MPNVGDKIWIGGPETMPQEKVQETAMQQSQRSRTLDGERLHHAIGLVRDELIRARTKFRGFNSWHEGYGVLMEEVDEMWDEIKANDNAAARREAVQVAAMALAFLVDLPGELP